MPLHESRAAAKAKASSKVKAKAKAKLRGRAKAAARAKVAAKNSRRGVRRQCIGDLNTLADELGASHTKLHKRGATATEFDRRLRLLERRCHNAELHARLLNLAERWAQHGGHLQTENTQER